MTTTKFLNDNAQNMQISYFSFYFLHASLVNSLTQTNFAKAYEDNNKDGNWL